MPGLARGDVVVEVNGVPIGSTRHLADGVRRARPLLGHRHRADGRLIRSHFRA